MGSLLPKTRFELTEIAQPSATYGDEPLVAVIDQKKLRQSLLIFGMAAVAMVMIGIYVGGVAVFVLFVCSISVGGYVLHKHFHPDTSPRLIINKDGIEHAGKGFYSWKDITTIHFIDNDGEGANLLEIDFLKGHTAWIDLGGPLNQTDSMICARAAYFFKKSRIKTA